MSTTGGSRHSFRLRHGSFGETPVPVKRNDSGCFSRRDLRVVLGSHSPSWAQGGKLAMEMNRGKSEKSDLPRSVQLWTVFASPLF